MQNKIVSVENIGALEVRTCLLSIFDVLRGGNYASDGVYYNIYYSRKYGCNYLITPKNYKKFRAKGRRLRPNEVACFCGERTAGISDYESDALEMNSFACEPVFDIWGNVPV